MSSIRHHFVSQGFLRGFAAEDESSRSFVWVYDKLPNRKPRKKAIRSIAWAEAYYAQEREDGTTDLDTVESALATTIDNDIPVILSAINPKPGSLVSLSEEQRSLIAFFIGISLTRVPSFRDGINEMYSQIVRIALSHEAQKKPELESFLEQHQIKAEAKPWGSLRPMIEMASTIAQAALLKNWQFYVPPQDVPFVTSDNPVVFSGGAVGLSQVGPAHPGAELVMNLRKNLALVCTPKRGYPSGMTFQLPPSEARKFNRGVVCAARQRVFASHESQQLDAFIKKYIGLEQKIVV